MPLQEGAELLDGLEALGDVGSHSAGTCDASTGSTSHPSGMTDMAVMASISLRNRGTSSGPLFEGVMAPSRSISTIAS